MLLAEGLAGHRVGASDGVTAVLGASVKFFGLASVVGGFILVLFCEIIKLCLFDWLGLQEGSLQLLQLRLALELLALNTDFFRCLFDEGVVVTCGFAGFDAHGFTILL